MSRAVVTLSELLDRDGVPLPRRAGRAVAQPHCHQHAVLGFGAERRVLARAGAEAEVLDTGCCGMAVAFGFEAGERYEVSVAVGGRCAARGAPRGRRADHRGRLLVPRADRPGHRQRAVHLAEYLSGVTGTEPLPRLPLRARG